MEKFKSVSPCVSCLRKREVLRASIVELDFLEKVANMKMKLVSVDAISDGVSWNLENEVAQEMWQNL